MSTLFIFIFITTVQNQNRRSSPAECEQHQDGLSASGPSVPHAHQNAYLCIVIHNPQWSSRSLVRPALCVVYWKRTNVIWNPATDGAPKLLPLLLLRLHHVLLEPGKRAKEAYELIEEVIFMAQYAKTWQCTVNLLFFLALKMLLGESILRCQTVIMLVIIC